MAWFNAGLSSNSGGASSFNELDDVSINAQTLSNGQVPIYNSTTHKWENGEQCSGHTIIDDGGTSLAQRDNLQFKGAYSEDNSANEKTVVNVVREMTKAEFDDLTDEEKAGFINITDITGGNDDRFQPVVYSTDEREIGVWVDGKPLYQKTIISTSELSRETINQIALGITDIDVCVSVSGFASYGANNTYVPLPYGDKDNSLLCLMNINKASSVANVWVGSDYISPSTLNIVIITLRYTKTTDTPGSGQWTPQGVPAHHYSTDEQVVGTWIDGSTIYEKTFDLGSDTYISYNSWTETSISWQTLNVNRLVWAEGVTSSGGTFAGTLLASKKSNGNIELQTPRNNTSTGIRYLTLRYTKSST